MSLISRYHHKAKACTHWSHSSEYNSIVMFFYVFAVWQCAAVTHVAERESNVTNEDSTSERKGGDQSWHCRFSSQQRVSAAWDKTLWLGYLAKKITNMTLLIAITIHDVHFLSQFWNTFEFLLLHIYISESYFMAKAPHQPCCIIYNRSTWGKALWIIRSIAIWLATALCWSVPKAKICRSVT